MHLFHLTDVPTLDKLQQECHWKYTKPDLFKIGLGKGLDSCVITFGWVTMLF